MTYDKASSKLDLGGKDTAMMNYSAHTQKNCPPLHYGNIFEDNSPL